MTEDGSEAMDLLSQAEYYRVKGDDLRKQNPPARPDEIEEAYRAGARGYQAYLDTASGLSHKEMAELHGVLGGLLRRLGELDDALINYEKGAEHERAANLPSTYNRLNTIRLALLIGGTTLAQLHEEIEDTAAALVDRLDNDIKAAQNAWSWADLADMQLLRGDEAAAADAYGKFVENAESGSSGTTLSVLRQLAAALEKHADPAAERVRGAVERAAPLLDG